MKCSLLILIFSNYLTTFGQFRRDSVLITVSNQFFNKILDYKKSDSEIKDSIAAIEFIEPLLFNMYGSKKIRNQRPYIIKHVTHFWVISGTLNKKWSYSGVFYVTFLDNDGEILELGHSK